jgi:hypothetical protein
MAAIMLNTDAGFAQDRSGGDTKNATSLAARLPPDYRHLMAQYIRTHNRYILRDAMISRPYERFGGLFRGGTFVAVCIAVFRDNPFGIVVRDNWVLTVDNGQVKQVGKGLETCSNLSTFSELKRR